MRVIIPKYLCMKEEYKNQLQYVTHFYMDIGYRREYVGIMQLVHEGIQYYFIDNEYYFQAISHTETFVLILKNYAFILKGSPVYYFRSLISVRTLIHCHDWQTGPHPVYLKTVSRAVLSIGHH